MTRSAHPRAPALLLGVDGGNTKSIALLATPDGTVVGAGRSSGSSDLHAVPLDEAFARLGQAVEEASRAAGIDPPTSPRGSRPPGGRVAAVAGAAFSLAGADWPEDIEAATQRLGARWPGIVVVNDAIGALRAGIPRGPGVIVVCGTGAATGARGTDGRLWHSSFWQLRQGAHELGVAGLDAVVRADLGVGPGTALTSALLEALGEPTVEAVLHRITGRATKAGREQASIAPIVLDVAERGDAVAGRIVQAHGTDLGRFAVAAARRVGLDRAPFTLALAGGVLRHGGRLLRDALTAVVLERFPATTVIQPALEPVAGALLLAFDAAGIKVDEAVDARLRSTMPHRDLFDTHPTRPA